MNGNILEGNVRFKSAIYFVACFLLAIFLIASVSALANPAAKYCLEQGNSYTKIKNSDGSENGYCIVKGVKKEEWAFFNGPTSRQALVGTSDKNLSLKNIHISSGRKSYSVSNGNSASVFSDRLTLGSGSSSFDWRNYSSLNWVTFVKDQGSCGACWAFSSVAVVEARINIDLNNSNYNADLSEQDVITNNGAGDSCGGGYEVDAMNFMKTSGIVKESCMPYTHSDSGIKCANAANEEMKINSYSKPSADANSIKTAISTYGPITAYMVVCYDHFDSTGTGIYGLQDHWDSSQCGLGTISNPYNWHSVAIVGYNDSGQYWIVKNSWGAGWGDNGFIKIAYNNTVYDSDAWNNDPFDYRIFFLDDSYSIASTDITKIPSVNNLTSTAIYLTSNTPINFSVNILPFSIKTLFNASMGNFTLFGNLTYGGLFNLTKTPVQLGCQQNGDINCTIYLNVSDDAGVRNDTAIILRVKDTMDEPGVIYPVNNSWYNSFRFNVTIPLPGSCWFSFNQINATMNTTDQKNFFYTNESNLINETLINSGYNVTFYCNNSLGNLNFTKPIYFGIDKTPPNLTINSPAEGYSETASSSTLIFSYNISDANNVANCSLIVGGVVNSINSTINSSAANSITSVFSAGSYVWSINCSDYAGNMANSSSRSFVITAPAVTPPTSGGGGGGGGSSYTPKKVANVTNSSETIINENQSLETGKTDNRGSSGSISENNPQISNSISGKIIAGVGGLYSGLIDLDTKAKIYIYAGIGVIVVILIFFLIRKMRHKNHGKNKTNK